MAPAKRPYRKRPNAKGKKNTKLVNTIKAVSKSVALKEAETKRVYVRVSETFDAAESQTHKFDVLSLIPQQTPATSGHEDVRIGNSVQPCWVKGYIFLSNIHHGNFDFTKNYSVRVMCLKDRLNVINDPNVTPSAMPLYRVEGQTAPATGGILDHCAPIDWRAWKVMMDKQYKLFQYSEFTAGSNTPFIKIPVSIPLTGCDFNFDRGNDELIKENIALFLSVRSFNGAVMNSNTVKVYYDLCVSFKDF